MIAKFISTLEKSSNKGGWTYATWSETVKVFGTRGAVIPLKLSSSSDCR
ncbi:MAG TPA: hypothetical protein VMT96_00110 [Candidatus Bathyarchaeia archaeon]|nr:hypothetical protein [Candidatus Bathyarchaeia archaeon]